MEDAVKGDENAGGDHGDLAEAFLDEVADRFAVAAQQEGEEEEAAPRATMAEMMNRPRSM